MQPEKLAGIRRIDNKDIPIVYHDGRGIVCVPNWGIEIGCRLQDKTGRINWPREGDLRIRLRDGQRGREKFPRQRVTFAVADGIHRIFQNLQVVATLRQLGNENMLNVVHQTRAACNQIAIGGIV